MSVAYCERRKLHFEFAGYTAFITFRIRRKLGEESFSCRLYLCSAKKVFTIPALCFVVRSLTDNFASQSQELKCFYYYLCRQQGGGTED